jgi:hypothetical protein
MTRLLLIWLLLRFIWRVVQEAFKAVLMAVVTLWKEVPKEIDKIAMGWVVRAINAGWPNAGEDYLYWCFYFVAWIIFLIGWDISAHLTILLEHLIFR